MPEVAEAVGGKARIIIDGGISRGTDVVKALILGADAVACGRLYVYGLAAAGAEGMVRLFEILEDEIRICLSLLGATGYRELDKSYIRTARQVVLANVRLAAPEPRLHEIGLELERPAVRSNRIGIADSDDPEVVAAAQSRLLSSICDWRSRS